MSEHFLLVLNNRVVYIIFPTYAFLYYTEEKKKHIFFQKKILFELKNQEIFIQYHNEFESFI